MRWTPPALLMIGCTTARPPHAYDPAVLSQIDGTIQQAIADHKAPGGVYHVSA